MNSAETRNALIRRAKDVALGIVEGLIDPNEGCSELGEICRDLDYPSDLSAFSLLAHEQHDHESLGITAENCVPGIIEECKSYLASQA